MFERIDEKLKKLAQLIFGLSVGVGGIWLLFTIQKYAELAGYIHLYEPLLTMFIYPIAMILCGIVTSYLIYGFGELISHVRNIDCSLKANSKTIDEVDKLQIHTDDEI